MRRIKLLNTGVKRLLFVVGIIFSLFLAPPLYNNYYSFEDWFYFDEESLYMFIIAVLLFIGFWICVWIVLWIIDGFKK
jgi:hypothetical protein